jgi:hypothetical protein
VRGTSPAQPSRPSAWTQRRLFNHVWTLSTSRRDLGRRPPVPRKEDRFYCEAGAAWVQLAGSQSLTMQPPFPPRMGTAAGMERFRGPRETCHNSGPSGTQSRTAPQIEGDMRGGGWRRGRERGGRLGSVWKGLRTKKMLTHRPDGDPRGWAMRRTRSDRCCSEASRRREQAPRASCSSVFAKSASAGH